MADVIRNMWPDEFKIDVQTPLVILRAQANYLSKVTRGVLEGTVETENARESVQHRLVVIAPAYNGYRHTLVVARHSRDLPYPVELQTGGLGSTAYHDEQMSDMVERILRSGETRAVIASLIAKSNEAKSVPPPNFSAGGALPQESGPTA